VKVQFKMAQNSANSNAYCQFPGNNDVSLGDGTIVGVVSSESPNLGLVELLKFDQSGDLSLKFLIEAEVPVDDHSNPALIKLDSCLFLSGHTGHDTDSKIKINLLKNSSYGIDRVASWEVTLPMRTSHVDFSVRVASKVLVVTRCLDWSPTAFWFDFETGIAGKPFILFPIELPVYAKFKVGSDRRRPYLLLKNINEKTYFTLTEDHPRNFRNGILAGYITQEGIFSLDDALCATLGKEDWSPTECLTQIMIPGQIEIPWVWDLAIYDNLVSIAFSWTSRDSIEFQSRTESKAEYSGYRVARYKQGRISYFDLGRADSSFCTKESDYVGGISLHPHDPSLAVISTTFDPSKWSSSPEKYHSLYLGRYGAGINRFSKLMVGPSQDYLRPRYIQSSEGNHQLIFMKGHYKHWTDFNTSVHLVQFPKEISCFTSADGQHFDLTFGLGKEIDSASPLRGILEEFFPISSEYFEWGAGHSTLLAIHEKKLKVVSVDVDFDLLTVLDQIALKNSASFKPYPVLYNSYTLNEWSFLRDKSRLSMAALEYTSPFSLHANSDLILIDGRFRLFCFYQIATKMKVSTTVIWDDFQNRPWYHSVEEFIKPDKFIGRAAVFRLTEQIKIPRTIMNAAAGDQR